MTTVPITDDQPRQRWDVRGPGDAGRGWVADVVFDVPQGDPLS
ncbi:hypothetical protein ACIQI8_20535 [Streptomyces sp. NPDC092369]